jgi:hypothetical protein
MYSYRAARSFQCSDSVREVTDDFASPEASVDEGADLAGDGGDRGVEGGFSNSIPFIVWITSY